MKHVLAIAGMTTLLLLTAGCRSGLKTENFSEEMTLPLAEGAQDSLSVSISLDYPVRGASEETVKALTGNIIAAAFDLETDAETVPDAAQQYESALSDRYLTENRPYLGTDSGGILSWEDDINGYFTRGYKNYDVYIVEYYNYRGGAHGMNTLTPLVLSRETGQILSEQDFFAPGYEVPVSEMLQKALREDLLSAPDGGEEVYDLLFVKEIEPNGCFEVSKEGVTWYYQPYEIGPYSLGVLSVTLPWKSLKDYLR